ncbi:MAG: hypothetical protein RBQ94_00850 [Methanimicrococcus sp.]|nr:hypothetical protein [Methanimicrococcus sp.]
MGLDLSEETYEKISKELDEWPQWKKDVYNENFAYTKNVKKI